MSFTTTETATTEKTVEARINVPGIIALLNAERPADDQIPPDAVIVKRSGVEGGAYVDWIAGHDSMGLNATWTVTE